MHINPINGRVLVELINQYGEVSTIEKQYATFTTGKILAVDPEHKDWDYLVGKTGYWEDFKDANTHSIDGKKYALVDFNDIGGWSE